MVVERQCVICECVFKVPAHRAETAKTCSPKCHGRLTAQRYAQARPTLKCSACGAQFQAPRSHEQRRVYCSRKCADGAYVHAGPVGDKHYAWVGGTTIHASGYRYVRTPSHPFGTINSNGYVFEHRVVMEGMLREKAPEHPFLIEIDGQRYLRPGISVHHINGIKRDNRPSNLLACTNAAHRAIHSGQAPMHGEVWPEVEGLEPYAPRRVECKCQKCGTAFIVKRSTVLRGGGKFCSRRCYDERDTSPFPGKFMQ